MNFKHFDRLITKASYDEIKVIGRDVELDGHYAHIIGMTLKDRQAFAEQCGVAFCIKRCHIHSSLVGMTPVYRRIHVTGTRKSIQKV